MSWITGIKYSKQVAEQSIEAWRNTRDFGVTGVVDLTVGDPALAPHQSLRKVLRALADRLVTDNENCTATDICLHSYRWPDLVDPELKIAAARMLRQSGIPIDMRLDQVVAGAGVSQLTSAIFQSCRRAGRRVLMFMPTYGLHLLYSDYVGANLASYPSDHANGLTIGPESIEAGLRKYPKVDVIFLVNPNNPTGQLWTPAETRSIARIIVRQRRKNPRFVAVVDEIYSDVILSHRRKFTALASIRVGKERLFDSVITLRGISKSLGGARIRIGIASADVSLLADWNLDGSIWRTTLAPSDLDQKVAAALWDQTPKEYFERAIALYRRRRQIVLDSVDLLNRHINSEAGTKNRSYVIANKPEAGFFSVLSVLFLRGMSATDLIIQSDMQLMLHLKDHGVGVMPGSAHGLDPKQMYLRISLSVSDATLQEGLSIIHKVLMELFKRLGSNVLDSLRKVKESQS